MGNLEIEAGRRDCPICHGQDTLIISYDGDTLLAECHRCVKPDRAQWFKDVMERLGAAPATHKPTARPHSKPKPTPAQAAAKAAKEWGTARPADAEHPYLARKKVKTHGARQDRGGNLIIPACNIHGEITTRQKITVTGGKRFLPGGKKQGSFHLLHDKPIDPTGTTYLCEGFATAASVQEATGKPAICAFDAGNLLSVAEALRGRYPKLEIVICGDDDRFKATNKGREAATATALAVSGKVCFPSFKSDEGKPTDFNDLAQCEGLEVVRQQVDEAAKPEPDEDEDDTEELDPLIPEQVKNCLPPAMQTIVKMLEDCSQTPSDIISLFLPVFTIPFLEGTVLKKSNSDPGRPPRLLATVIGPSGSGKTTPLERLRHLYRDLEDIVDEDNKERVKKIREIQAKLKQEKDSDEASKLHAVIDENCPRHKVYQTQTGSRQGLCRALGDGSNPLIILDEIGRFISRASKGGPESDNMDCITELADQGCIRPPLLKGTVEQGPTKTIYGVSFGLYGTTTAEDLPQKKAANLLKGGFFSRQLIGIIDEVKGFPGKNYLTEQETLRVKLWRDCIMKSCKDAEYSFILDNSAVQVFQQYREKISQKFVISGNSHEHHAGQIIRRVKQAEDVCLIFHCTAPDTNCNKYISGITATLATLFVDYFHERHHPKFLRFIAYGEQAATRHAIGNRVLKYLERHEGKAGLRDIYHNLSLRKKVAVQVIQHLVGKGLLSYENRVVSLL